MRPPNRCCFSGCAAIGRWRVRWPDGYPLGMPKPPLPPEIEEFLAEPNPSVIATLALDGSPPSAVLVQVGLLWAMAAALCPVALAGFALALRHAKKEGSLVQY